jgi:ATP-dependent protease ClpP protease subunit
MTVLAGEASSATVAALSCYLFPCFAAAREGLQGHGTRDYFMSAEEAVVYGIIDRGLTHRLA